MSLVWGNSFRPMKNLTPAAQVPARAAPLCGSMAGMTGLEVEATPGIEPGYKDLQSSA